MPRKARIAPGGIVFHVCNGSGAGVALFGDEEDYRLFATTLAEAVARFDARLLAWCAAGSDWRLVVWPHEDNTLSRFVGWMTMTHAQRYHARRRSAGIGAIYRGRFRSFPVQGDASHITAICAHVERTPVRDGLTTRPSHWPWCSAAYTDDGPALSAWPIARPIDWLDSLEREPLVQNQDALTESLRRGTPFGAPAWRSETAAQLGLSHTLRSRGRPRGSGKAARQAPTVSVQTFIRPAIPQQPAHLPVLKTSF